MNQAPTRGTTSGFDPRPKTLLLLFGVIIFFLPLKVETLAVFLGLLGTAGFLRTRGRLGRALLSILPILILVALLTPLFTRLGEPLWRVGSTIILTTGGLEETGRLLCRFTGITICFALFYITTPAESFIASLRWFGLPFKAALVLNLTLRFIPSLFTLYQRVEDAHSLRRSGESAGGRGFFGRLKRLLPTLTSVLIQAVKRIAPLSMTLELRGIGAAGRRTSYIRLPRGKKVKFQFLGTFLFMGILIAVLVISPGLWYNGASG